MIIDLIIRKNDRKRGLKKQGKIERVTYHIVLSSLVLCLTFIWILPKIEEHL